MPQRYQNRLRASIRGPWAGLVVAWDREGAFDESAYRADLQRLCRAGVPGVYTGGTSGEFYALDIDEFERIARATVAECHKHHTPVMIGCTATSTRQAIRRAAIAAELGAEAIQVPLTFCMEVPDDRVLPFFEAVSAAAPGLALSVYETRRAKKALSLDQHLAIHRAVPAYVMVKANAGTLGVTPEGCERLSEFVNVFVNETLWPKLGPHGAIGSCSAMVYWNPWVVLELWSHLCQGNWGALTEASRPAIALHDFIDHAFGPVGFTDTAYDRMVGLATGFLRTSLSCRGPYRSPSQADVDTTRNWIERHYPRLLRHNDADQPATHST